MKTRTLLLKLSKLFPKKIAKKHHDYVGLMAGVLPQEISRITLCLDLDYTILDKVEASKPDLVITHHPLIFGGTRFKVFKRDPQKKAFVLELESKNIPVYSMHTNFDEGLNGMNDALAKRLLLREIKPLTGNPMARGGKLDCPLKIDEFAKFAQEKLDADYGLLTANGKTIIESVAIIGGGGSRSWKIAKDEGYDIFISGDAPHYVRRDVILAGYNYLDLPHEIENIFMEQMERVLLEIDETIEVTKIYHEKQPKVIN